MPIPTVQAVGRTYDKLNDVQRNYVWEQREKNVSGAEIARRLGVGIPQEDPPVPKVKITSQAVNSAYRTMKLERDQLYFRRIAHLPTDAIMERNRRELSAIAGAELDRLRQQQLRGKLDAVQLAKLTIAIERIEKLEVTAARRAAAPPKPPSKPDHDGDQEHDDKPRSFADSLVDDAAKREAELQAQGGDDDVAEPIVTSASGPGEQERPVPDDLPGEGHYDGSGVSQTDHDRSVSSSVTSAPSD